MGGGECFCSAPFRTGLHASRYEDDPGPSAPQSLPGTVTGAWQPADLRVQFWGTLQVLILLSFNVQLSLALSYPRRSSQASPELLCRDTVERWPTGVRGLRIPGDQPTKAPGRPGCLSAGQRRPRVLGCVSLGRLEWMPDTYLQGQCIKWVLCGWVGGGA